ncbi:MAG: cytochrome c [Candidatus Polarisedimenticolaceae bacterium]|nr:cytochrome c [Candidatus Polarisedimenticolaceae bacterium]
MKKILLPIVIAALLVVVTWFAIGEMSPAQERWYSMEQVSQGKEIYSQYCRDCHGESAGGMFTWQTADAEGHYPPPPLDGSGHTWHHSLSLLRKMVREGGAPLGGTMPPFEGKLTAEEIDAAIAWLQSLWPVEIYTSWRDQEQEIGY